MEKMNEPTRETESVSRSHSSEVLDTSSASSLSIFTDQADGQDRQLQANDNYTENHKPGEFSPRASVDEALKSEAAFIQFLTSIPPPKDPSEHHCSADSMVTRNRSPAGGPPVSKVGLDHLDNLCKLMEQLSELRDNNSKLQKRVQYLEDLKTLHDMHKEICEVEECSPEDTTAFKPGLYQLKKSATEVHCPKKDEVQVFSKSPSRYRRGRIPQQTDGQRRGRSKSVGHEELSEDPKSRRLFPKWSRVKEAFGWESERKESLKMKGDCSTILNSRRRSDESRRTFRHYRNSTQWYQDSPINSSVEEINPEDMHGWKGESEKITDQLGVPQDSLRRQKSTPSPGSDKSVIYQVLKTKSYVIERDSYRKPDYKDESKRGKSPWGRVKTIIERHRDSLKRRSLHRDHSVPDLEGMNIKSSLDEMDFKLYEDYFEDPEKQSPKETGGWKKPGPIVLDKELECVVGQRVTPNSSPTLQRKSRWNKMTKVLKGKRDEEKDPMSLSTPNSPHTQQDGHFTFDVIEESSQNSPEEPRDISRIASDSHVNQLALSSDIMLQLQRNLSEDFHRKIQEWDRIRANSAITTGSSPQWDRKPSDATGTTTHNRKKSDRDEKSVKNKIKDLTWLEKELQKIEKEKLRLAKEKQKYEERGHRLQKLKETFLSASNSGKREVLVRTSAGEFRFEGISDAFTKKLYEWETKRGLGPELSTIALLDSSRLTVQQNLGSKPGPMQRVLSRSESSLADIGLPSHNSSNSLPSVKLPDSSESDKLNQPSRANSEPDLATLTAFSKEKNSSPSRMITSHSITDASDLDIAISPGFSKGSEEEDFDKHRKGSETYYGLLEENVILLEQLKVKEEICRRLEKDLGILDEKMDEMNSRHVQETHRYREKLWEMHQQGASPRDVQCCRRTMEQLRKRIEALEKWTQKLRNDRETVEVNFRYHSKEQENMTLDLLGKMRELHAAETSNPEIAMGLSPRMDVTALERLQDLSALLTQQTQDLEDTLSEKSRQICQLKWELLHRDLSCVKMETEQHTHSAAHKKRTKYAHWRSRSSEEASTATQKMDPSDYDNIVTTDEYCAPSPLDTYKATNLANTVQELNKEVLKLTSDSSVTSLPRCIQDQKEYPNEISAMKNLEVPSHALPSKVCNLKKITVRRSSADNLSLVSTDDNRYKNEVCSTTHSEDSTDDYYSRVCYGPEIVSNFPTSIENERLLMSYGENSPRSYSQRKKKFQKASKLNSALLRKRSNTFHTNRDLQKPNIIENAPQKCHSFRVARENYLEDSVIDKASYSRRKLQNSHFNIRNDNCTDVRPKEYRDDALLQNGKEREGASDSYITKCLREVASDSKLPAIVQAHDTYGEPFAADKKSPLRSMSDKTKKETATERREQLQKKRMKRRLKSLEKPPEIKSSTSVSSVSTVLEHTAPSGGLKHKELKSATQTRQGSAPKESCNQKSSQSRIQKPNQEIPTITIQLPKRKHRRSSYKVEEIPPAEEQSFVIVMPKKRSLSSECDSSISENSPRELSVPPHSCETDKPPDFLDKISFVRRSCTDTSLMSANGANGNIHLMKLVSLETFDTPFYSTNHQAEKVRKAEESPCSGQSTLSKDSETRIHKQTAAANILDKEPISEHQESGLKSQYIKSPSAPHLDLKKANAYQKVSKASAPNVKSLIERYNQKVMESQIYRSPASSNVSSPAAIRKISSPAGTCSRTDFVPQFCSTPNTPTFSETAFKLSNSIFSKSPPSSPMFAARAEALKKAKETFISSQISTPNSPLVLRNIYSSKTSDCVPHAREYDRSKNTAFESKTAEEDGMSCSSMDSMNLVMLRAGENCREKRTTDFQRNTVEKHPLKPSKSLSNSSLFKTVLSPDFKMPTSLLRLKRSKRKKDMSAVTELCRQSLLLATDDAKHIPPPASAKSCPASPEMKAKSTVKSNWLQRNIFRQK